MREGDLGDFSGDAQTRRRGFLTYLAALPLIGGAVALRGKANAVDVFAIGP